MVIGLLIGGVLKGQELIENAKITRTIKDLKDFDTAVMIFRSTYNALPGDIRTPTRLPNCSTAPCNSTASGVGSGTLTNSTEQANFWRHLFAAGLISSLNDHANPASNPGHIPISPLNSFDGNYHISYPTTWYQNTASTSVPANMNMFHISNSSTSNSSSPSLHVIQTMAIDTKIDDGKPFSGSMRTFSNCGISEGTDVIYNNLSSVLCRPYIISNSMN